MRRRRLLFTLALLLTVGFVAGACGSDSDSSGSARTTATTPAVTGTITVSAAASLTEAFGTITTDFEAANPGSTINVNFGSSGTLETQIEEGASVDVAAFADEANMKKLADKSMVVGASEIFATNQLIIVTKPGNPENITTLADLATAGTISLCADTAPCGKFANQILQTAGVTVPESSVTRGQDVKTTLAAVTEGDAEAAMVYVTDAQAAGAKVETVEIPTAQNVVARYPIAVIEGTTNDALAAAFMAYVLGPEAQAVLREAGFQAP